MAGLIYRIVSSWRSAKAVEANHPKVDREPVDREFLPAALEILETPASPFGRILALFIAGIFVTAVVWSVIGRIDTVATATGRIVPDGKVKLVQPMELATVQAIHVREGQSVAQGELLVELDATETSADRDQVARELLEARLDVARLTATVSAMETWTPEFNDRALQAELRLDFNAPPNLIRLSRSQMAGALARYQTELASLYGEIDRLNALRQATTAEINKLTTLIPLIAEREEGLSDLAVKGFAARPQWLEVKQQLVTFREDLVITRQRMLEHDAEEGMVRRQIDQTRAASIERLLDELLDARNRADQASLALQKAERREAMMHLLSPVSGRVQQLATNTVGGVVSPADPIMVIVPKDSELLVEARVLNKDVGFVTPGQKARVKIDSFPYTKYGIIEGEVRRLSADAVEDELLGLVYTAEIVLSDDRVLVGQNYVTLTPGMSATVEIQTGDRAIIEYFLSPLQEYQDETLNER